MDDVQVIHGYTSSATLFHSKPPGRHGVRRDRPHATDGISTASIIRLPVFPEPERAVWSHADTAGSTIRSQLRQWRAATSGKTALASCLPQDMQASETGDQDEEEQNGS